MDQTLTTKAWEPLSCYNMFFHFVTSNTCAQTHVVPPISRRPGDCLGGCGPTCAAGLLPSVGEETQGRVFGNQKKLYKPCPTNINLCKIAFLPPTMKAVVRRMHRQKAYFRT